MTHKLPFHLFGLTVVASLLAPLSLYAQSFPEKPIWLVVPFPPGGATDNSARVLAKSLAAAIGQAVIIDNRPGANGRVGAEWVLRSKPDGYTLLFGGIGPLVIAPHMEKVSYNTFKDFTAISCIVTWDSVLVVNPLLPAQNISELIAYLKNNGNKVSYGSAGYGAPLHIAGELFKTQYNVNMTHIPYKGDGPGLIDLINGNLQVMFTTVSAAQSHINSGRIRNIGAVGSHRSTQFPEIATVAEQTKENYAADSWGGLFGPAELPKEVLATLTAAIEKISKDKTMLEQVHKQGSEWVGSNPIEFNQFLHSEYIKWGRVIKDRKLEAVQ